MFIIRFTWSLLSHGCAKCLFFIISFFIIALILRHVVSVGKDQCTRENVLRARASDKIPWISVLQESLQLAIAIWQGKAVLSRAAAHQNLRYLSSLSLSLSDKIHRSDETDLLRPRRLTFSASPLLSACSGLFATYATASSSASYLL